MNYIKKFISRWLHTNKDVMTIIRYHETETETLGLLYLNGEFICYTLELPWKHNTRDISCIPEGTYEVVKHPTNILKLRVNNVPGRSGINMHIGNSYADIEGCILVGMGVCRNSEHYYLISSAEGMKKVKTRIGDNPIILNVMNITRV